MRRDAALFTPSITGDVLFSDGFGGKRGAESPVPDVDTRVDALTGASSSQALAITMSAPTTRATLVARELGSVESQPSDIRV